jgi:choline monooxygenase
LSIFDFYLPESALTSSAARDATEFSHQVQVEDVAICEQVQKNLHSRSFGYSVTREKVCTHFIACTRKR